MCNVYDMETETRTLTPFPAPPDFAATDLQRRQYLADMREAWLDRAERWTQDAQRAAGAGDQLRAELHLSDVHHALTQARLYRPQVTP